jgi:hypothetical protein
MFTVAGVSINKGNVKVRFCSDLVLRVKNLQKQGDTDIQLVELPQPMDKWHACEYLLNSGDFSKYASEIVEIQSKKLGKAKQPKVVIQESKIDPELEAIKALAA